MTPVMVADTACHVGEAPLWHPTEKCVYWSDIPAGILYRLDPVTDQHAVCYRDRPVGGFTLQADGSLLLFRDKGNVVVWRAGEVAETVVGSVADLQATRFNDVCADPEGRVFCGTMADLRHSGRLYRLDLDGKLTLLFEGLGTPNGMGFSPDQTQFFFNDSHVTHRTTWLFDYDRAGGTLRNRRVFRDAKLRDDPGNPDGLAVDAAGGVWTARWDGAALLRHSPTGEIVERFAFPVKKVSSLCFAGDDLTDIYCTTAGGHLRPGDGEHAGALFRIRGHGVAGQPRHVSRLGLAASTTDH